MASLFEPLSLKPLRNRLAALLKSAAERPKALQIHAESGSGHANSCNQIAIGTENRSPYTSPVQFVLLVVNGVALTAHSSNFVEKSAGSRDALTCELGKATKLNQSANFLLLQPGEQYFTEGGSVHATAVSYFGSHTNGLGTLRSRNYNHFAAIQSAKVHGFPAFLAETFHGRLRNSPQMFFDGLFPLKIEELFRHTVSAIRPPIHVATSLKRIQDSIYRWLWHPDGARNGGKPNPQFVAFEGLEYIQRFMKNLNLQRLFGSGTHDFTF